MAELGCRDAELSIVFMDDARIQELNRQYLHRDHPTNVLAFSMKEGEFPTLQPHVLGDLIISVEPARRQSTQFGLTHEKMIFLLMAHGILHLLGYDHEGGRGNPRKMATRQKELLHMLIKKE